MIAYRQFVPNHTDVANLDALVEKAVREHLSRNASNDDSVEFASEVVISRHTDAELFGEGVDTQDGYWVCGTLDRDPTPFYGTASPVEFDTALERDAVDLTPEEYVAHMQEKEARGKVAATLQPGEWVMNKSSIKEVAKDFLNKFKTGDK